MREPIEIFPAVAAARLQQMRTSALVDHAIGPRELGRFDAIEGYRQEQTFGAETHVGEQTRAVDIDA